MKRSQYFSEALEDGADVQWMLADRRNGLAET